MRVGVLTEFPSPSVQSGPAIHTRFLSERLRARGHDVTLMGPDTGDEVPIDACAKVHLYKARPFPTHPKVKVAMPAKWEQMWNAPKVDVVHSQTATHMVHYAIWMRKMHQVALLNTHTVHLPTHSHFVISDKLYARPFIRRGIRAWAESVERGYAKMYNEGDCLIVQSRHFVDYWRERGVTIPIEVVGRPIDPEKFSAPASSDPFPRSFKRGSRLLVVRRQDREKRIEHLLDLFDEQIAPHNPDATLTLVGDGHDQANLKRYAESKSSWSNIHFPGEVAHGNLVHWYKHADVFAYTSLSETFGNVVNEALWCGLPVVALNDNMGVAHQVYHGENGFLVEPHTSTTDVEFGGHVVRLLSTPEERTTLGEGAMRISRANSHPDVVVKRFEAIYERALDHVAATVPNPYSKRSRAVQAATLIGRLAIWSSQHRLLLGVSRLATALGAGRKAPPAPAQLTTGRQPVTP